MFDWMALAKAILAFSALMGFVVLYLYSMATWPVVTGSFAAAGLALFFIYLFYGMFSV